ncbi:MAG: hypothetical protein HYT06_01785 [Candidatus Levybacteria bacterium]|nr:hypothetical protein [Candidatus Levybacteria bacterium]
MRHPLESKEVSREDGLMIIGVTGEPYYRRLRAGRRIKGAQPEQLILLTDTPERSKSVLTYFPAFFTRVFRQPPTTLLEIREFYAGVLPTRQGFEIKPDIDGIMVKTNMGIFAQVSGIQGMTVMRGFLDYSRRIKPQARR